MVLIEIEVHPEMMQLNDKDREAEAVQNYSQNLLTESRWPEKYRKRIPEPI